MNILLDKIYEKIKKQNFHDVNRLDLDDLKQLV